MGLDEELGGPEMVVAALDGPHDITGFKVEEGSGSFVVEVVRLMKTMGRMEPSSCS